MSAPTVPATSQVDEPAVSTPKVDLADLKRKSVRGGMVTMLAQGISIAIQVASTVTLSRLLSPQDYGMIAMVTALTAFAGLFRDLGLSAAAIQKGKLTHDQMSNLFWLNVGMGGALTLLLLAASPLVAWFYGRPELTELTALLSVSFIIGSLGTQHGALMQRQLQLGRKAITAIAGSLVALAVSLVLAISGWSYWSLAWGSVIGASVTTALLFLLSPFRPKGWTQGAGVRSLLAFGANVTIYEITCYLYRNLDNILIGKVWGAEALGAYSRAYSLLTFPVHAIRHPINSVTFPALCRLQDQPDAYRGFYRRAVYTVAFFSMPLATFLFVASSPLIQLLLGDRWKSSASIYSIFALYAFIQPVAGFRGAVLLSCGLDKRYVRWGAMNGAVACVGFLTGIAWGSNGVATAYVIANYLFLYPSIVLAFKDTPLRVRDFFEPLLVPAIASIAAGGTSLAISYQWKLPGEFLQLLVAFMIVSCGYILATGLMPGGLKGMSALAQSLLRQR